MFPYLQEVELQAPPGLSNFFPTRKKSDVGAASECELAVALAAVHGVADEVEYELYDENWFGAGPGATAVLLVAGCYRWVSGGHDRVATSVWRLGRQNGDVFPGQCLHPPGASVAFHRHPLLRLAISSELGPL